MLNNVITQLKLLWMPYQIRSIQNFVETIKIVFASPVRPEYDIYQNFYNEYLDICKGDNTKPLNVKDLCKVFRIYEMSNVTKVKYVRKEKGFAGIPKQKVTYGMEIKLDKLDELIKDCKEVVISNGTTVVMQNDWPHFMRITLVPVNNKIAEAILGRKVEGLSKENKTLEN